MLFSHILPPGPVTFAWEGECCTRLWLSARPNAMLAPPEHPVRRWLDAYASGRPAPLPPLAAPDTPFQARLRKALLAIPRGETRTYGEMARLLGSGPRGVGQALKANPLPVLIPCHRIVAAHGPGGFACSLSWKQQLLALEDASATRPSQRTV